MRLDQFLSESRIIKRRTLAKQACDNNLVRVDGQTAKPSKEIRPHNRIRIDFADRVLEIEVLEIPKGNVKKDLAKNLYRILREEYKKDELV